MGAECSRRLVHNEAFGLEVNGAGNSNGLPLPTGHLSDRAFNLCELGIKSPECACSHVCHALFIEKAECLAQLPTQEEICRGVQIISERQVLIDSFDSGISRIGRAA